MKVIQSPFELRKTLQSCSTDTGIGMVPTMGNFHDGHLELVRRARAECDVVVTTLFVNPLQFGANEDFDSYPRTLETDQKMLESYQVEILFCPSTSTMYPDGRAQQTTITVPELGNTLCGRDRPGHFDGVTTIVAKLFNLVQPDRAYFGEKDWQQLAIIRRMVGDLNIPVETIGVSTVRATDNLALSSRNQYLSAEQRQVAPQLYSQLCHVRDAVLDGDTNFDSLERKAMEKLTELGFRPDYVAIRDAATLESTNVNCTNRRIFGAAYLGRARLIDNIPLDSS